MKVALGSDKSGFLLKEAIKQYLKDNGIPFDDLGTTDLDSPKGYFVVAPLVAGKVQAGEYDRAILICGTGAGMSVVANKFKGVYAVACESVYTARMARAINNAQILCMGGWIVAPEMGVNEHGILGSHDKIKTKMTMSLSSSNMLRNRITRATRTKNSLGLINQNQRTMRALMPLFRIIKREPLIRRD
mgnify:CR=1 FL=1